MVRKATLTAVLASLTSCSALQMPAKRTSYYALGNDPGWTLQIGRGITFAASTGNTYVETPAFALYRLVNGRRFATDRIIVDVFPAVCVDSRSGIAFADRVVVTTSNVTFRGCGGKRVPLLDK